MTCANAVAPMLLSPRGAECAFASVLRKAPMPERDLSGAAITTSEDPIPKDGHFPVFGTYAVRADFARSGWVCRATGMRC